MSVTTTQSALASLVDSSKGTVSNNQSVSAPFTARLQLLAALSKVRVDWNKDQGPKPEEGNFWCGPPGGAFLGQAFRCIPLAWRDHALRIKSGEVTGESYNAPALGCLPTNEQESMFSEIKSKVKDKSDKTLTHMAGKDILLWIPEQAQADKRWPGMSVGKFAIYFLHATALPEADNFKAYFGKAISCRSKEIPGRSFTWCVPEVDLGPDGGACSPHELPDMASAQEELTKFNNPVSKSETVQAAAPEGRTR